MYCKRGSESDSWMNIMFWIWKSGLYFLLYPKILIFCRKTGRDIKNRLHFWNQRWKSIKSSYQIIYFRLVRTVQLHFRIGVFFLLNCSKNLQHELFWLLVYFIKTNFLALTTFLWLFLQIITSTTETFSCQHFKTDFRLTPTFKSQLGSQQLI